MSNIRFRIRMPSDRKLMPGGQEELVRTEHLPLDQHASWPKLAEDFIVRLFGVAVAEYVQVSISGPGMQDEFVPVGSYYAGIATHTDGRKQLASLEWMPDFKFTSTGRTSRDQFARVSLEGDHARDVFTRWEEALAPGDIRGYGIVSWGQPEYDPATGFTSISLSQAASCD